MNNSIDAVISYVNPSDRLWAKDYSTATGNFNVNGPRFRSWGTLKYLFRSISENMPFVDRIVLIVARESQVPIWVNRDTVKIIYHEDFIPKQFLPTFNSCTIESFLWNISDLSDKIIYFNDDMFAINSLTVDNFFTKDMPHLYFEGPVRYSKKNIFRCQCRTGMDMIANALNTPLIDSDNIIKPLHIALPITKDSLLKVSELCGDKINKSISMLRKSSNVNQYIYSYYQYFNNNYICSFPAYQYFEITEKTILEITDTILAENVQLICINDSDNLYNYTNLRDQIQKCFESKFPNKCRYEL